MALERGLAVFGFSGIVVAYTHTISLVLLVVRLFLGLMILAHGYQKFFRGGRLAGTARWFDSIGMKPGRLHALAAASTEVAVGILMTLGLLTPLASAGLIAVMAVAIVTVHRHNGFFNFNKGQGIEYNLAIMVMALVPGAIGPGQYSIDHAAKLLQWTPRTSLLVTVVLGLGAAALQLALFYRPLTES